MPETGTLDLVAEDLTADDWETMVKDLVGGDLDAFETGDIQACGCLDWCDNGAGGWCVGLCW